MTILELYNNIGANYKDVSTRIPSENLIKKFLLKFSNDETFNLLTKTINDKDYKEAFRAVHTLKGICLNMSFDNMTKYVLLLTEELRNKENDEVDEEKVLYLYNQILKQYNITINSIKTLD